MGKTTNPSPCFTLPCPDKFRYAYALCHYTRHYSDLQNANEQVMDKDRNILNSSGNPVVHTGTSSLPSFHSRAHGYIMCIRGQDYRATKPARNTSHALKCLTKTQPNPFWESQLAPTSLGDVWPCCFYLSIPIWLCVKYSQCKSQEKREKSGYKSGF